MTVFVLYHIRSQICLFIVSRYTSKADAVYAIVLEWPATTNLTLVNPVATNHTTITMLGYEGEFDWKPAGDKGGIIVIFPAIPVNKLPSKWAWVLKLENIKWI